MSQLIPFTDSPLAPFLGPWLRDPLSVSRNKVVRTMLGADGLRKLWACNSMEERLSVLNENPALEQKYRTVVQLAQSGMGSQMEISAQAIVWLGSVSIPAVIAPWVFQVSRVSASGKKVTVHAINARAEKRGRPIAFVLRMSSQWLLVSEQYTQAQANIFPRSPVFRYYRPS